MRKYRKIVGSSRGNGRKETIDRQSGGSYFSICLVLVLVCAVGLVAFLNYSIGDLSLNVYLPPELVVPDGDYNTKKDNKILTGKNSTLQNFNNVEIYHLKPTIKDSATVHLVDKEKGIELKKQMHQTVLNNNNNNNNNNNPSIIDVPNPKQNSKFAYVTLISGIDKKFKYRGFLYNALIMKESLAQHKSTADFIALVGYNDINDIDPYRSDMNLLKSHGIIVHVLHRLLDHDVHDLSFAEMALLKVTPWSFVQYDRIQFFDGDVMPTKNMDCFFSLEKNTFTGADMDQGLLAHRFVINKGGSMLIDTDTSKVRIFEKGFLFEKDKPSDSKTELKTCGGILPTYHFAHFTGRSKPWMLDLVNLPNNNRNNDLILWRTYLDGLKLEINSTNIGSLRLGSPLGFFNANFPKGGYKNNKSTKKKKKSN